MNDTIITIDPRQWQDPARVAELRRLAALGLVVREIAKAMGTTPGAVRHALARYAIRSASPRRSQHQVYRPNSGTMTSTLQRMARREARAKADGSGVPVVRGDGRRDVTIDLGCQTSFDSLGTQDCRWPGQGTPTLFCGASPVAPGISYCPRHAALAYRGYSKGPQP